MFGRKKKPEPEQPLKTFPVRYYLRNDRTEQVVKSGECLWGIYADGSTRSTEPFDVPAHHSIEFLIPKSEWNPR